MLTSPGDVDILSGYNTIFNAATFVVQTTSEIPKSAYPHWCWLSTHHWLWKIIFKSSWSVNDLRVAISCMLLSFLHYFFSLQSVSPSIQYD